MADLMNYNNIIDIMTCIGTINVMKYNVCVKILNHIFRFNVVKSKATKEIVKNAELEEKCEGKIFAQKLSLLCFKVFFFMLQCIIVML